MLPDFHTANQINCTFASDKMMTPTRTYSPVKISVRYVRYAETHGFTGHEHYAELKIINMNGRLFDPVIARFFSPDNFVQSPDFTQSFNRYSYCLNNPLQYVDPSGEKLKWWQNLLIGLGLDFLTGGAVSTTILCITYIYF